MAWVFSGPLGSRAAKAIGFIEKMIDYSYTNAPLQKELRAGNCQITLSLDNFLSLTWHCINVQRK